jgi:hypothetical protein
MECRTVDQQYSAVLIQYSAMQCSAVQYICANTEVIAKRHLSLVTPSQQIVESESRWMSLLQQTWGPRDDLAHAKQVCTCVCSCPVPLTYNNFRLRNNDTVHAMVKGVLGTGKRATWSCESKHTILSTASRPASFQHECCPVPVPCHLALFLRGFCRSEY